MKQLLLPLTCFGPIQNFAALATHPIVFEGAEHFVKQSYRNRYEICGPNGMQTLSVPIKRKKKDHTPFRHIEISYAEDWQYLHWKSLEASYRSSAYFEFYEADLEGFYKEQPTYLFEFNLKALSTVCELLEIPAEFTFTNSYEKQPVGLVDLRTTMGNKNQKTLSNLPPYQQVFESKNPFYPNLSILDLLFNLGPQARQYLLNLGENLVIPN